ncbi:Na+/H+ antiporter NhaA [Porticoccus sp.]|uniref:Na+/H+ antiporter NhaA n=1 Tax=Porticoccus sp. TaxID=2024853 RepID=UPI003F696B85
MSNQFESRISRFFRLESAVGIVMMLAAIAALICANSPVLAYYGLLLDTPVAVMIGEFVVAKPLLMWINDGLMAVFFFLIGLELKRELIEGELSEKRKIILPGVGALGGMLVPAMIYLSFNSGDGLASQGWAIPAATDIAFALGVLSLLGSRVPVSLKVFLTSLAVFDDIGAIIIIAIFYTANISLAALLLVCACLPVLALLNRYNVESKSLYIAVGTIMWLAMLKSGVHATLAGVIMAMFIPLRTDNPGVSPLKIMERDLQALVAFFVLPVFAFANAGISFTGLGVDQVFHPVPLGIALGLFVGKQVGVFGCCWIAIKLGVATRPKDMSWGRLYGIAALCGIGFTMSLFISSLAFEGSDIKLIFDDRLGILAGSVMSGVIGYLVLRRCLGSGGEASSPANTSSR